jgi:hypothetical protein
MHFYVDESGSFANSTDGSPSLSAVGVLCVPSGRLYYLEKQYSRLRKGLPKLPSGEVKGRLLNEDQVASIIDLACRIGCIFEVSVVNVQDLQDLAACEHRDLQAKAVASPANGPVNPSIQDALLQLSQRLLKMPAPLYRQLILQNETVHRAIQHAIIYFVFRRPQELASFQWIVDSKSERPDRITDWEDWWQSTLGPMLQSKSMRDPIITIIGEDYSYFERFIVPLPDYLKDKTQTHGRTTRDAIDIRAIVMDQITFESFPSHGLEICDILTNAARRALTGNLGRDGWRHLGKLIVHVRDQHRVQVLAIGDFPKTLQRHAFVKTIIDIDREGLSLLP